MKLFNNNKQEIDEKVKQYQEVFFNYIDKETNDNTLNRIFTEITILRIKLDGHDNIITNHFDSKKLSNNCNKKDMIKFQFDDIIKTSRTKKYKTEGYNLIDSVMKTILPMQQKNDWELFWEWIRNCLDKATGKK